MNPVCLRNSGDLIQTYDYSPLSSVSIQRVSFEDVKHTCINVVEGELGESADSPGLRQHVGPAGVRADPRQQYFWAFV